MPLISPDDDQMTLSGQRGSIPQPRDTGAASSSVFDLLDAAARRSNLAGTLTERVMSPKPSAPAVPGFDPEVSVPKGYEPVADIFAGATSPQDIEWRRQQYDREQQANQIIAAHHGWGLAASMAFGTVDPVTLASMAIPGAGETRLIQAGRTALAAGVGSAAQELGLQALEVSRTPEESALNVAASTVLGGVLGAVLRPHVPKAEFTEIADRYHQELHGEGGETVMGPMDGRQRIIPEADVHVSKVPESAPSERVVKPTEEPQATSTERAVEPAVEAKSEETPPNTEATEGLPRESSDWKLATPEELAAHTAEVQKPMAQRLREAAARAEAKLPEPVLEDVPQAISEMHVNPNAESTSGAAQVAGPTMAGESFARGAQTLSKTLGKVSPGARLMNSASLKVRQLIQEMANLPETLEKNWKGAATASPIERELWKYDGVHYQGMKARGMAYKAYRERVKATGEAPLNRGQFNQEIAYAMRRGDESMIPEVAGAARRTRALEFEPLKLRAIKAGLLPADVKAEGAMSYLMRQYDHQKITANLNDWLDRLTQGFRNQGVETAEARDIAHKVTRNIQGSERGTMDWKAVDGIVPESGQLKERTLKLPDELLEPYLNNDIDHVAHSYLRSMAPEVEMHERFGSRDMREQLADVRDDYARMIEREITNEGKAAIYGKMEADLRDLTAVRDRLYGIFGQPKDPGHFAVRAGRLLRSVNALRLLGAATLAHFPDIANVMMRYGMTKTMAAIGRVLTSKQAFNLTREEAKRMGAGLDMTMNATAAMLGDYATHSQFAEQRIANKLTRGFTIVTGETPLITAVQQLTSTMAQDEIIRAAQQVARGGKKLSPQLSARLAGAGLDRDMLTRIAAEHQRYGAKIQGLEFGMSDKWTDQEASRVFESAILRDAHSVTLRPGVGDTPLFMSTEWGKALRQFTTFGFAAQRSVVNPLMQGLAHGDPRAAQALLALTAMGTLSYMSKQTAAGQPIEPWNSPRFALEVLDKSNLMGWTADLVFPALWMLGFKNLSRWSDRDPVETIGGPAVGTVFSTYAKQLPAKALASAGVGAEESQKGLNRSDMHFIRRLMPGQNLWYLRSHINSLEDAIGDSFDLPGKSNADRAAEAAITID